MSDSNLLITTSDNFSSQQIKKHLGLVDAQIVIGANIFRDVFSGFRDIFGGEIKGYQKDIDKMKSGAFSRLKSKALKKGANAVISTRIDLDEVSGGGKSMFMLNVYGSAVQLEESVLQNADEFNVLDEISQEDLEFHIKRNRLRTKISQVENPLDVTTADAISELDLWSLRLAQNVIDQIVIKPTKRSIFEQIVEILDQMPSNSASYLVENYVEKIQYSPIFYSKLINTLEEIDWYDGKVIKSLLASKNHIRRFRGLRLSAINASTYNRENADQLGQIADFIRNDFDSSIPMNKESKMIGSKTVFTCPRCLNQRKEGKKCYECSANRYGFKKDFDPATIAKILDQRSRAIQAAFEYQS